MIHRRASASCLALALLAGCAAGTAPQSSPPSANGPLLLSADGFLVGGTGLEIGFGRAPEGAIAAISDLTGTTPTTGSRTCSATDRQIVQFPDGLAVTFRDRMFTGWDFAGPPGAFTTREGLTTGIAPEAVPSAEARTLDRQAFAAGGINGRVGADGRIARLWAGAPCPAP